MFTADVTLWFAQNKDGKYTTIFDINDMNKDEEYLCPACQSKVIPKAIKNNAQISRHFAHIDASKCNAESLIHWCYKNNFLIENSKFSIVDPTTDKEINYICKSVEIEKLHESNGLKYRPDVTLTTTTGEIIYFEMDYKNKKKPCDYINIWLEFNHTVVEVNIQDLLQLNTDDRVFIFKPIFYCGKCYSKIVKRKTISNQIINLKENVYRKDYKDANRFVNTIDWFWKDLSSYKLGKCGIEDLFCSLDYLISSLDYVNKNLLFEIITKFKCNQVLNEYYDYKKSVLKPELQKLFSNLTEASWYSYNIDGYVNSIYVSGRDTYCGKSFDLDEYSTEDLLDSIKDYIQNNYKDVITHYINDKYVYRYPKFLHCDINLSVPYHNIPYFKTLRYYNFVEATERLTDLKNKMNDYIEAEISKLSLDEFKDYAKKDKLNKLITFSNEQLDKELYVIIYPLIHLDSISNGTELNICLNYRFTKDTSGKTRRWLIKDFIDALNRFDIMNVHNFKED